MPPLQRQLEDLTQAFKWLHQSHEIQKGLKEDYRLSNEVNELAIKALKEKIRKLEGVIACLLMRQRN